MLKTVKDEQWIVMDDSDNRFSPKKKQSKARTSTKSKKKKSAKK